MHANELIQVAKAKGYRFVQNGDTTTHIDDFAETLSDNRDYTLLEDGTLTYNEDGFTWFDNTKISNKIRFTMTKPGR